MDAAIEKYYGQISTWNWSSIISPPPQQGPWPEGGMVLRKPLLVAKKWNKGMESPGVRVGRVISSISCDRVACVGFGVSSAKHPVDASFIIGYRGAEGFHLSTGLSKPSFRVSIPNIPKEEGSDRAQWEEMLLTLAEGNPDSKKRLADFFEEVAPFVREEEMDAAIPQASMRPRSPSLGGGRL